MKKFCSNLAKFGIAAMMAVSMTACSGGSTEPSGQNAGTSTAAATAEAEVPQEKVIKIATTSDPGSLGAFDEGSSSGRWTVLAYTYENLIYQGTDGQYHPWLAKSWTKNEAESTPTHVVYDVELFDYITDFNGNNITADDVVFSFNECLTNGTGNQHTALTGNLDSIEKTGDYTFKLAVNSEAAGGLEQMMTQVMIVSQKEYEGSGDCMRSNPIGTGAYKVDSWTTGSSIILTKNEDYWQKEELRGEVQKQNVDRIEYYFVTESTQMAIGLETGIYDVVTNLNFSNASRFMEGGESSEGFTVTTQRDTYIQQMWVNRSEESPLHDLRIAQAVLYAIDIDALITAVVEGHGEPCYCYGSDLSIGFQPNWKTDDYYLYNLPKAKELLSEAGVKDGDISLTILCDTDEVRSKIAQVIKLMLTEIGINAEVTSFEQALWNTYQTDPTKFDLNISYNGATGYITNTWRQLDSTRYAEHNMAMVRDNTLDSLIQKASISQDDADLDAAKQYMTENAYHYALFHKELNFVTNSKLITKPLFNLRGNIIPGASEYVWN
ncbi:MAG: ABC transporter substrate-binding protein [Solobacterium sp.]|nr:ABC transporter substrate-binding protein [Solobacterium sp.]MCR5448632.1 ABC transporter substrate-binding protein [Solobacterium sp.]